MRGQRDSRRPFVAWREQTHFEVDDARLLILAQHCLALCHV